MALATRGESRLVYARYRPRRIAWPTATPEGLPEQARRDGLCLWVARGASAEGLAAGLGRLLELEVAHREGGDLAPAEGLVLDLRDPATRSDKLRGLVSLAERYVLTRPR